MPGVDFNELGFLDLNWLGLKIFEKRDLIKLIQDNKEALNASFNLELVHNQVEEFLKEIPSGEHVEAEKEDEPEGNTMSFNYTWLLKISTTPKQKQRVPKPMASVNAFTVPYRKNFMLWPFARRYIQPLRNYNRILTIGWIFTTRKEHTQGNFALGKHPCKHGTTQYIWPKKNCWIN